MGIQERIHFHCPPQCPGVERFKATIHKRTFPAHSHEGFVIGIVQRGAKLLQHAGHEHHVPEGSVVFLNPDELHAVSAAHPDGVTYQTLHVPADVLHHVGGASFRFTHPVEYSPMLANGLEQQFAALDDPSVAPGLWLEKLRGLLMDVVIRQRAKTADAGAPLDQRIHRLVEYISRHITDPLSLVALASEVHLSPQHLVRSFKHSMGVTPHAYIQARRTALAKKLLRTNAPADAAASAGFADQSHLTRWMKACYGTTPALYRRYLQPDTPG